MNSSITTRLWGFCLLALCFGCSAEAGAPYARSVDSADEALFWFDGWPWSGEEEDPNEVTAVRVASVQIANVNDDTQGNLQKAAALIEQAAADDADLVLLPEFFACGYLYTDDLWLGAETLQGPTAQWMKQTARQNEVWLGGTILEADGGHFFNTFLLVDRQGELAGTVRKQVAAGVEAFFFREDSTAHVIETDELGTIGVGICYENYLCSLPDEMMLEKVDLMLMPYSYPSLNFYTILGPEQSETLAEQLLAELGLSALSPQATMEQLFEQIEQQLIVAQRMQGMHMADRLGVPAVTANKVGVFETELPPLVSSRTARGAFTGQSGIFDANGEVLQQLDTTGEGLAIADVELDPALKRLDPPGCFSGPTSRHSFNQEMFEGLDLLRAAFYLDPFSTVEQLGILSYTFDADRRRAACGISNECLFY